MDFSSFFKKPLVLASRSYSRQLLLRNAGISFTSLPSDVDEDYFKERIAHPYTLAETLSFEKASRISSHHGGAYVIGSDQVMVLNSTVLGKPTSFDHARSMFMAFLGQRIEVYNSIHVVRDTHTVFSHQESAFIHFVPSVPEDFFDVYFSLEKEWILQCTGGLRLEGLGTSLMERLEGDYFTVMGLSLIPLLNFLRAFPHV